ncbi:MAG: hypothetical protein NT098_06155 [Candidatus Parcubacteria bacterium]|nr:hypothetical protein [Candidatus Parcubacteria bacterium]
MLGGQFRGEVTGSNDGSFSDIGADKAVYDYSYAASSTNSIISLPSRELVTDQPSNTIKDTKWYYDGLSLGSFTKGNSTKEEKLISGSIYASTTKAYDGTYGLVTQTTDALDHITSYLYDIPNLFVATSTNPLGYTQNFLYNYSSGKVATTTDENGMLRTTRFDGLGRPLLEKQPDFGDPSSLVTAKEYSYTDSTSTPSSIHEKIYLDATISADNYTYLDGFRRVAQTKNKMNAGDEWATRDIFYNVIGQKKKETLPYFTSSSSWASSAATNNLFTSYSYDALGRLVSISDVFGTTTNSYQNWALIVTDPLSNSKVFYKDSYGNLSKVVEPLSYGLTATTTYEYNLHGNLTKVTDASSNVRNFSYDNLGKLLVSEDLHTSDDTTFGTTTRQYDNAGNLIQSINPDGFVTSYAYDELDRLKAEDSNKTSFVDSSYLYDSCSNGIGRLCRAEKTNSSITAYSYNPIGLISTEAKKIGGTWSTTTTDYERNGLVDTVIYPNGYQAHYTYNIAGQLYSIAGRSKSTDSWEDILLSTNYSPIGMPKEEDYGNNTKTMYTYDPDKKYRLTKKQVLLITGG